MYDLASGKVRAITEDDVAGGQDQGSSPKAVANASVKRVMLTFVLMQAVPLLVSERSVQSSSQQFQHLHTQERTSSRPAQAAATFASFLGFCDVFHAKQTF